jgi:hypothetical protein
LRRILELPTPVLSLLATAIGVIVCLPLFIHMGRLQLPPEPPVPAAPIADTSDIERRLAPDLAAIRQRDVETAKQAILARPAEEKKQQEQWLLEDQRRREEALARERAARQAAAEQAAIAEAARQVAAEQAAIISKEDSVNLRGITRRYNKFQDYTTIRADCGTIARDDQRIHIYLYHDIQGKDLRQPKNPLRDMTLCFHSRAKNWQYLKDHEPILVVGDRRFPLEASNDKEVEQDGKFIVSEWISARLPGYRVQELLDHCTATGKEIEMSIGVDELPVRYLGDADRAHPTSTLRKDLERFLVVVKSERLLNKLPEHQSREAPEQ